MLKFLDRTIGSALVLAMGALRTRHGPPNCPSRIGILKTRGVGDAVLSSTLIAALKCKWPSAQIVYFPDEYTKGLVPLLPGVDEISEISSRKPWRSWNPLRAARLDLMFDLGAWPRIDALLTSIADCRFTVGFKSVGQRRHYAYDLVVEQSATLHQAENYLSLLTNLVGPVAHIPVFPTLRPANRFEDTQASLPELVMSSPFVVLHAWAGGSNPARREWDFNKWIELARRIRMAGYVTVISGGPLDEPNARRLSEAITAAQPTGPAVISLAGRARLIDMYWVLERAAAVVSVNTGVMHMAAAIGAVTIALNGPTNPRRWGPLGPRCISITPEGTGCGFLDLGFEYRGQPTDCMQRISLENVSSALISNLQSKPLC